MNTEPKQRKLDFLEGIFSSHGDCPSEKPSFSKDYVCPVDWMFVLASCVLSWSVLEKHLLSHPPALSRLHGNSPLSVCTCHYDISLFGFHPLFTLQFPCLQFILHGLECLLFRTVGSLFPDHIVGVPPGNGYLLALIKTLACSGLASFLPFPKACVRAYLSFKPWLSEKLKVNSFSLYLFFTYLNRYPYIIMIYFIIIL